MRLIFSLLLACLSTLLWSQTDITISGTVVDNQGIPVADHLIVASSAIDVGFFEIGFSDSQGKYKIEYDEGLKEGCLDLTSFDCDGSLITEVLCWDQDSLNFMVDYDIDCSHLPACRVGISFQPMGSSQFELIAEAPQAAQPINYKWSTGEQTKSIVIDINAYDDYCVSITDADGCQDSECIYYGNSFDCEAYFYFNENDHTLESISTGLGELTYKWKKDDVWLKDTTDNIVINKSGEYCLEIADAEDCVSLYCDSIDLGSINPYCHSFITVKEDTNGNYYAEVSAFGIAPFEFLWSNNEEGKSILVDPSIDVRVVVTDAEGCVSIAEYAGNEPLCSTELNCKPINDLSSEIFALAVGIAPFEYQWNTMATDPIITIDQEGEYCVTVTDARGCSSTSCEYFTIKGLVRCDFELVVTDDTDGILTIDILEKFGIDEFYSDFDIIENFPVQIPKNPGFFCVNGIDIDGNCIHNVCLPINNKDCEEEVRITIDTLAGNNYQVEAKVEGGSGDYYVKWNNGIEGQVFIAQEDPCFLCAEILDQVTNCRYYSCLDHSKNPLGGSKFVIGTLLDQYSGRPVNGVVDIYVKDLDEYFYYETVETENGVYTCDIECNSEYLIKAINIESNVGVSYVPSFYNKSFLHEGANPIDCSGAGQIINTPILANRLLELKGPGTIGGHVIDDIDILDYFDTDIILTTLDSVPVKYELYQKEVKFEMDGIPYGNYYLYLSNLDLPTIRLEIEISPEDRHKEVVFNTAGISTSNKPDANIQFSIHPNPTIGQLRIKGLKGNKQDYKIINQVGQLLQFGEVLDGNLDVSQLPSGLYFLHFPDYTYTFKFIKI